MRIRIDGANTLNKGAELMLYAVLQEIERKQPNAVVEYNPGFGYNKQDLKIKTALKLITLKSTFYFSLLRKIKIIGVLYRLGFPTFYFNKKRVAEKIDLLIDVGGYQYGDVWNHRKAFVKNLELYYSSLKKRGTIIVHLPQAFGPFNQEKSKKVIAIVDQYSDLIIARDKISRTYLLNEKCDPNKVVLFPDFTTLIKGKLDEKYRSYKNKVCIIPNYRMVDKSGVDKGKYVNFLLKISSVIKKEGYGVFLLNHEGVVDKYLCLEINKRDSDIQVLTGLNALDVKNVISQSYLVITSRFHGAASALSSGVPCLVTSWSHKYKELLAEYNYEENVLSISLDQKEINKVLAKLNKENNEKERLGLQSKAVQISEENVKMWDYIWRIYKDKVK